MTAAGVVGLFPDEGLFALRSERNGMVRMRNTLALPLVMVALSLSFLGVLGAPRICRAQTIPKSSPATVKPAASAIAWTGPLGSDQADPETAYCLMGSGFFRSPTSPDFDRLVAAWRKKHPTAVVVPVVSLGPVSSEDPKGRLLYVWLRDSGGGTLNEYLVRQGACQGGTMTVFEAKDTPLGFGSKPKEFRVPIADYRRFVNRIEAAEDEAFKSKHGIWRKGGEAEMATPKKHRGKEKYRPRTWIGPNGKKQKYYEIVN